MIVWAWLVTLLIALSVFHAVTAAGLWGGLVVGLVVASVGRQLAGPPRCMSPRAPWAQGIREALGDGPLVVLAVAVGLGFAYTLVAGIGVAANDGDALAYHLPRALLWKQQRSVSWIADATDPRIDVMPPVAEMGQLATMLVSGRDRFVAMGQLVALAASMAAILQLARRLGGDLQTALFGALLFATLPVVILQAASALNDLVVCSFLACAAALVLSPSRRAVAVGSVSTALAVATKVTAVFGLPWIALLVVGFMRRGRLASLVALVGGALLGSWWYLVNLWHTGHLDGGYGAESGQRPDGLGVVVTTARQLTLDVLDLSGVNGRDVAVYGAAALTLVGAWVVAVMRGRPARGLLLGALLVAIVPPLFAPLGSLLLTAWQKAWVALGRSDLAFQLPTEFTLPVLADATESWYGPVLGVCLVLAPAGLLARCRHRPHRHLLMACATAPLISIVLLATVLTYDPYRGRFLMFAVALAAVSWGSLLRWPAVAWGLTGLAIVSGAMALAMSMGRPSGLVLFEDDPGPVSRKSIWTRTRVDQQIQLRPGADEIGVIRFVENRVPENASIALALHPNDFVSPYSGERLRRRIVLVPPARGERLTGAEWLVTAPRARVDFCPGDWQEVFGVGDWKVLERVGDGGC